MSAPEFQATSYPIRLYLCRNRREWNALMRTWDVVAIYPDDAPAAFMQLLPGVYTINVTRMFDTKTKAERAGLLAHEATHAWQHIAHQIGEFQADESSAYTVQAIVEWAYKIIVDGAVN